MCAIRIAISISDQSLELYQGKSVIKAYSISSAENGPGQQKNSGCTPLGEHYIRAKVGHGEPENTVYIARRKTGEIYTEELGKQFPNRDWILTRIMWLSGREVGKNRLGRVDSMQRYIYIHGTPDSEPMGVPLSHGCIRMRNLDLMQLYDLVPVGTPVTINL